MSLRKIVLPWMAIVLVLTPFMGVFVESAAAATNRGAIISELTGTVQVKKSGGSKQFKAFAKMSLNEGDILTTGSNSTAVLKFANGTSEDDKMSVSANTTLTFSKLSDRKGTRTKVSMFNGTAWVDVKSIASKDDEFTLQTPTAIMGVRGTHLLVSVDPDTGSTKLTVAAGVVNTQPTGDGADPINVKPGDNALIAKDQEDNGEITIAPVDLERLVAQTDKSIVEAIVAAAGDIVKENEEKLDEYFADESAQATSETDRKKSNVENLLGAIVDNAVKTGLITQERANELVAEAETQTGVKIDLIKKERLLSDEEKKKQEEQRSKEEEAKRLAEEQKLRQEDLRKQNEELLKKLEAERKAKEEENRKAEEEKKRKAEEEYQRQLDEAAKQRLKEEKEKREAEEKRAKEAAAAAETERRAREAAATRNPSPSPTPTSSSVLSGDATLAGIAITKWTTAESINYSPVFKSDVLTYSASVANDVAALKIQPRVNYLGSMVKVNGTPIAQGDFSGRIELSAGSNEIRILVTAENGVTRTYVIRVFRAPLAENVSIITNEDTPYFGTLAKGPDDRSFIKTSDPVYGSVTMNVYGAYTYTPNPNFNGEDSFTFRTSKDGIVSSLATVSISVMAVNDSPTMSDIPDQSMDENTEIIVDFGIGDVDMDELVLSANSSNSALVPNLGSHLLFGGTGNSRTLTIKSADYQAGLTTITVTASDGTLTASDTFMLSVNDTIHLAPSLSQFANITIEEDSSTAYIDIAVSDSDTSIEELNFTASSSNQELVPDANIVIEETETSRKFKIKPTANGYGTTTITISVSDGSATIAQSFVLTVIPVNDAPMISAIEKQTSPEDVQTIPINFTVSDLENGSENLSVEGRSSNPALIPDANITFGGTGGNRTVSVMPALNQSGTAVITITVSDGTASTMTTFEISIIAQNDAPWAKDYSMNTNEDAEANGALLGSDVEEDELTFIKATDPEHGTATVNADGTFRYLPNADFHGTDSFKFKVSDGSLDSTLATVTIIVAPVNDDPSAESAVIVTDEDTPYGGSLMGSDRENAGLTFSKVSEPMHGTVVINSNGTFIYTPNENYSGPDSFKFIVNDGVLDSAEATVSVMVNPINDAPTANKGTLTTAEDTAGAGTLSGSDIDSNALTFAKASDPAHGSVIVDLDGTYTYTPAENFTGSDSFSFTVSDGSLTSVETIVLITVTAMNDAPMANPLSFSTNEDTAYAGSLSGIDLEGDTLSFAKVTGPSHGTVTVNANGTFIYSPASNYYGTDSFSFRVTDGFLTSAAAEVSINVISVDDEPTADSASFTTAEDTIYSGKLTYGNIDGLALSFVLTQPAHGTVTVHNWLTGAFSYMPHTNYYGPDSFKFRTWSGFLSSTEATMNVTITPVNDQPTNIGLSNLSIAENAGPNAEVGVFSAIDVDTGDTFAYSLVSGEGDADNGYFNIDGNILRAVTSLDFETKSSYGIRVRVQDSGGLAFEKRFTVLVTNVNDAPVAYAKTVSTTEDTTVNVTLTGTDAEGSAITYSIVSNPVHGTVSLNSITGIATYQPILNYNGADSFTYRVSDGSLWSETVTVSITVIAGNDAPTGLSLSNVAIDENLGPNAGVGTISTTDIDSSDSFIYSFANGEGDSDNGSFVISGNTLRAVASLNYEAKNVYRIRLKVTDSGGATFEEQFTITVNDIVEGPADITLSKLFVYDDAAVGSVVGTFSQTGSDIVGTLTYKLVGGTGDSDNGAFAIDGEDLIVNSSYDATKSSYSIRVRVTDGSGLSYEEAMNITVKKLISYLEIVSYYPGGGKLTSYSSHNIYTVSLVNGTLGAINRIRIHASEANSISMSLNGTPIPLSTSHATDYEIIPGPDKLSVGLNRVIITIVDKNGTHSYILLITVEPS